MGKTISNKWSKLRQFSEELNPVVEQLNALFDKYQNEIVFVENFISFPIRKNRVVPFISVSDFKNSYSTTSENQNNSGE